MTKQPIVAVLYGGVSSEREVSLGSGLACAIALARSFPTLLIDVTTEALPKQLDPAKHVVFSTLHGTFGEDGAIQKLFDAAGITYGGCDAAGSALTMNKALTKQAAAARGVTVARGLAFPASQKPTVDDVLKHVGPSVVIKPNDQGSSVGLSLVSTPEDIAAALAKITTGNWLVEQRIVGREFSIGVLKGEALGVVEIRPKSGVYDYTSKYTKGMTEYLAPAPLDAETTGKVQRAAETAFAACSCRDYARVDFILGENNQLYLLEINTLPGMKETSLLPMSARCKGLDFTALVREMITPALQRFQAPAGRVPRS